MQIMGYPRMFWWSRRAISNLLSECCICRMQATVIFPCVRSICPGEFVGLDENSLTLNIYPETDTGFRLDCQCCVTFNHGYRPHVFFAYVLDYGSEQTEEPRSLVLEVPYRILAERRRIANRVPIIDDHELVVEMKTENGRTWMPTPKNVSVAGMLVEFSEEEDPNIAIGSMVDVILQLPPYEVELRAEIVRRYVDLYGLYFPGVVSGNALNPPSELAGIVRMLERRWYEDTSLVRTREMVEMSTA